MAATKRVTVEISAEAAEAIVSAFPDAKDADDALRKVVGFSGTEIGRWLKGGARYRSLTDQHIEWVTALLDLMAPGSRPTVERLYNDFNMTHGQATYVSRVLSDRRLASWRKVARDEMRKALMNFKREAEDLSTSKRPDDSIELTMPRLAGRELTRIAEKVWQRDPKVQIPTLKNLGPDTVSVSITARTVLLLLAAPEVKET